MRHPKAGGAEQYLHRQALCWIAAGHRVKWFAARFAGATAHEVIEGVEVFRAGGEYSVYAAAPFVYFKHLRDCDVLIDAENGIPFFTPLFSRKPKVLLMFHVHREVLLRELPKPISWFTWALEVWAMPLAYRRVPFVAISQSTRDDIKKHGYTRSPVTVIVSGVDHKMLYPGPKFEQPTIAYLGRVVRYKRIRELIEAFARVRSDVPNVDLFIAGAGSDLAACRDLARQLDVEQAVFFEGFVSEERKRELLAGAWVSAQPSRIEGWGIGVIEAAACGTPSVAQRVSGLQDAIVDGETGRLVETWDDFRGALTYILTDDAYRARLSKNALEHSQAFSWQKSADQFLARLEEIA